jgi:hypothetical protein
VRVFSQLHPASLGKAPISVHGSVHVKAQGPSAGNLEHCNYPLAKRVHSCHTAPALTAGR